MTLTFFVRSRFMESLLHYLAPRGASRESKKQVHGFSRTEITEHGGTICFMLQETRRPDL